MAQKGEKKPLESLKTTAPSPLSVPAPAPESIPGQEHPQGRSDPREERSQGRALPGKRGMLRNKIHFAGSLEETSSDGSGKILPSRQKAEGKDGKEGREGGRKAASRQAPPDFPKEPAQHGRPVAPGNAKRKEKALPRPGGEMSKNLPGKS